MGSLLLSKDGAECGTENERWAPIPGFMGYDASTSGRIRSCARVVRFNGRFGPTTRAVPERILRPLSHTGGYARVMLWQAGFASQHFIHKLILVTFHGPRPLDHECCHLNGDKQDNRISNLMWGTRQQNQQHREVHGTGRVGKPRSTLRYSQEMVDKIRLAAHTLNRTQIARAFNIPRTSVGDIVGRRTHRK